MKNKKESRSFFRERLLIIWVSKAGFTFAEVRDGAFRRHRSTVCRLSGPDLLPSRNWTRCCWTIPAFRWRPWVRPLPVSLFRWAFLLSFCLWRKVPALFRNHFRGREPWYKRSTRLRRICQVLPQDASLWFRTIRDFLLTCFFESS